MASAVGAGRSAEFADSLDWKSLEAQRKRITASIPGEILKAYIRMTHAEAFANLQRELSAQPDVLPEGWFTSEQWAEKTGVSEQHTRHTIRKAMAGGKMERSKFRIPSGGRFVSLPHYRIK